MYKLNTKIWLAGLTSLLLLAGQVQDSFASSLKKGVGSNSAARVQALNASWYYNWNIALNAGHDPATEYVAMRHNRWWQSLAELANVGTIHYLLGFNEPERPPPQGDTTVAQAIALWPDLETAAATYGLELGSPVPANANHPWLTNFMNQASTLGLQVDFMTMHKYPRPNNPQAVLNDAARLNSTYGKDVWVTGFNGADWGGNNEFTHGEAYTVLIESVF